LELGVQATRLEQQLAGSVLKKRLVWMRVCRQGKALWHSTLEIPTGQGRIMQAYDWQPSLYFHCPPCFEQIRLSSAAGPRLQRLLEARVAAGLLAVCWGAGTQALDRIQASLREEGARQPHVSVPAAFGTKSYLRRQLCEERGCAGAPQQQRSFLDYRAMYGLKEADVREDTGAGRPCSRTISDWAPLCLPGMTVHVAGEGVKVTVAVLAWWRTKKVLERAGDANFLIKELVCETGRALAGAGRAYGVDVVAHKLEAVKLGDSLYSIAQCASDRPAFVLTEKLAEPDQAPSLYCYLAMGLPDQHQEQQTLLARCANVETAAFFVVAVQRLLKLRLRLDCVAASQKASREPARATAVRDQLSLAGVKFDVEEFDMDRWMNHKELLERAVTQKSNSAMLRYLRLALPERLHGTLDAFATMFLPS
jgi:hypothetical protein